MYKELIQGTLLQDLQVVELGDRPAGSILGMLLADQGARVTKFSLAGQAESRPYERIWNRGKVIRPIEDWNRAVLDLQSVDIAIDAGAASGHLPEDTHLQVVLCRFPEPDFGAEIPIGACPDALVGAMTALHQVSATDETPALNRLFIPSTLAALRAASAVLAALVTKLRSGTGQVIDVPLVESTLLAWGRHLVDLESTPDAGPRLPLVESYQCADGRYLQLHGNYETKWSRIFLTAANRPDLVPLAREAVLRRNSSAEETALWRSRFTEIMRSRRAEEWEAVINQAGGAAAVCRSIDEWMSLAHPREAGLLVSSQKGQGALVQPGLAVEVHSAAHQTGGDSQDGVKSSPVTQRADDPGAMKPLSGLRVLDLTLLIAGPTVGRTLAEFGADVIKIDDPHREHSEFSWEDTNRGKRSLLLNLKSESGLEVFWHLLDGADAVLTNFRPRSLERIGISPDDCAKRKSDLVFLSMNTYGYGGGWSDRAGWEQLIQAASGAQIWRGGPGQQPQVVTPWVSDYGAGLLGAYGVVLALLRRLQGWSGFQHVTTSLAQSLSLMQLRHLHSDLQGRREMESAALSGSSSQIIETADGWVLVEGPFDPSILGQAKAATDTDPMSTTAMTTEGVVGKLRDAGVPAAKLITLREIASRAGRHADVRLRTTAHPLQGRVTYLDVALDWPPASADLGRAPTPGENSVEILREAGFKEPEISALLDAVIVSEQVRLGE